MAVIDDSERASTGPWIGATVDIAGTVAVRRPGETEISMSGGSGTMARLASNEPERDDDEDKQRVRRQWAGLTE